MCAAIVASLLVADSALAQQVYWAEPARLGVGQRAALDLVFADTEPTGRVALPRLDGLEILGSPSQASSVSIVNGRRSASVTLSYPVRPQRQGKIGIPAFEVETNAGTRRVAATNLQVGAPTLPQSARGAAVPLEEAVAARLRPSDREPFAGEVFDVDVIIALSGGRRGEVVGSPAWDGKGIIAEPWSDAEPLSLSVGAGMRFRTRALAPEPGSIELPPVKQEVQIETGREKYDTFGSFGSLADRFGAFDRFGSLDPFESFDSFFSRRKMTSATVSSNATRLRVRPLPQPAPPGFTGAVGKFAFDSKIVPEDAKAGEPVTWTLTLRGTGNWPGGVELPARAVPKDIRTLRPKKHKEFAAGELFTGSLSEDLVMVPATPGEYRLEPVRFVYFDPEAGRYETATVSPPALMVGGSAVLAQAGSGAGTGAIGALASSIAGAGFAPSAPPAPPASAAAARLPRDPLGGSGSGFVPLGERWLFGLIGAPFAVLAGYWLLLAFGRARQTDPHRPRREALEKLTAAIERVRGAAGRDYRAAGLLAWQGAAGELLEVDLAAPTPSRLHERCAEVEARDGWIELWTETDRALYGREYELASSWCDRAAVLCSRLRRLRFNPLRSLLAVNLLPKAAAAGLALVLYTTPAGATALDEYAAGDFAAARAELLERVQGDPSDWTARYNLGLADAQLGDAGRALANTTAAFLGAPRAAAVRWNLEAFAAGVPGLDGGLARLIFDGGPTALARLASPAAWQALAVLGAVFLCLGGAAILRGRYGSPALPWVSRTLLAAGALAGSLSWVSLHQYGTLAKPEAAMVVEQTILRSVPTEAAGEQVQKPISGGAVVAVEKNFLGWVKVALPDGESGWLRHDALVQLYAAPGT